MTSLLAGRISSNEAAEVLGVHPQTIRVWARTGKLPALRRNKEYFFAHEDLIAFLKHIGPTNDTRNTDNSIA